MIYLKLKKKRPFRAAWIEANAPKTRALERRMILIQGQCSGCNSSSAGSIAIPGLRIRPDLGAQQTVCWLGAEVFLPDLCYLQNRLLRQHTSLFGEISGQQSNKRCATLSSKVPEVL